MKKFLSASICLVLLFYSLITPICADFSTASGPVARFNNTAITNSTFVIQADGCADAFVSYVGYAETTGATITTKLQKKFLGLFWVDVNINQPNNTWTDNVNGNNFSTTHSFQLDSKGTYRAVIKYIISGGGGEPDVIDEVIESTY